MILLSKKTYEAMIEHAKKGFPNEACGILAGPARPPQRLADTGRRTVSEFFPMTNRDNASISYFMDPKEQLVVFKKMRQLNIEMTAIFHSHVASVAYPSRKDIRLAFYPEVSYLIVSLSDIKNPVLRSFKIKDEKVSEEEIKIV